MNAYSVPQKIDSNKYCTTDAAWRDFSLANRKIHYIFANHKMTSHLVLSLMKSAQLFFKLLHVSPQKWENFLPFSVVF